MVTPLAVLLAGFIKRKMMVLVVVWSASRVKFFYWLERCSVQLVGSPLLVEELEFPINMFDTLIRHKY